VGTTATGRSLEEERVAGRADDAGLSSLFVDFRKN
jgi:hypothetical protein